MSRHSYFEASARTRILSFLDTGSFTEVAGPARRLVSPHLEKLGLPQAFDDGVVTGRGTLDGKTVFIAAQEGNFNGGAVGEIHGAKLLGLMRAALTEKPSALILMIDSGGVRLHEANAGIIAISEISRALLDLRAASIPVLAIVAGSCGAFGGMGIVTRLCHGVLMSEEGRLSLSGPEVIETVKGKEEFNSRDRALVWRITGGKIRRALGEANRLLDDDILAFREATVSLLKDISVSPLTLQDLVQRSAELFQRDQEFAGCRDGAEIFERRLSLTSEEEIMASPKEFESALRQASSQPATLPSWDDDLEDPEADDEEFFAQLFRGGLFEIGVDEHFVVGSAVLQGQQFRILGTRNRAPIGYALAIRLSAALLSFIESDQGKTPTPIILLADTEGQLLARRDELLGLNGALAHLALCVDLARRQGHRLVTIVRHEAVSGGFLAFGMLGDRVCALPDAQVRVMDLRAMARVTKIPLEDLQSLAKDSPVFAPGAPNYEKMGAVHTVWQGPETWSTALIEALQSAEGSDHRAQLGLARGGRQLAEPVSAEVVAELVQ